MIDLALLADPLEEGWPSMDLAADELARGLGALGVACSLVRPPLARRLGSLGSTGRNADRVFARFRDYPRLARSIEARFFHVVDHSYAQLALELPAERTGVYCHDLDAFRCLLEPALEPRPFWFRALARRTLAGLVRARWVFHSTATVGAQLVERRLVAADRLVQAPIGVAREFSHEPAVARGALGSTDPGPFLLHVGSSIPRKRIDVLLAVVATLRRAHRELRLEQVGGEWTAEQRARIMALGLDGSVRQRRGLAREELADLYRRAALVLIPSEREGFGIPLAEALACGAPVLASAIPALREVGGEAARFATVGDVSAWVAAARELLERPASAPPLESRLARARLYSWEEHARTIARTYGVLPRESAAPISTPTRVSS